MADHPLSPANRPLSPDDDPPAPTSLSPEPGGPHGADGLDYAAAPAAGDATSASPVGDSDGAGSVAPGEPGAGSSDQSPPKKRRRKTSRRRLAIEWLIVIAVTVVLTLVIKTYVVEAFVIPSGSMEPTLKVGDRLLVDKIGYSLHRGDIIVFDKPPRDTEPGTPHLVKRIIGLPGDTVSLHGGYVSIDGQRLNEHWLPKQDQGQTCAPYTGPTNCGSWHLTVPPGQYLVMGDNRADSYDSRYFGTIPKKLIVGKAFLLIWPLGSITTF